MALVVEQTLPYSISQLHLDSSTRWEKLFPLIRPSLSSVKSESNHSVLIDLTLAKSNALKFAAIGSLGNISSRLLHDRHITAIASEEQGGQKLSSTEIAQTLRAHGTILTSGLVIIRIDVKNRGLRGLSDSSILEVCAGGCMEFDHILGLLASVRSEVQ